MRKGRSGSSEEGRKRVGAVWNTAALERRVIMSAIQRGGSDIQVETQVGVSLCPQRNAQRNAQSAKPNPNSNT